MKLSKHEQAQIDEITALIQDQGNVLSELNETGMAERIGLPQWGEWLRSSDIDPGPRTPLPCTSRFRAGYRKTGGRDAVSITMSEVELHKLDRAIAALPKEVMAVIAGLYLYQIPLNRLPAALETTRHYVIVRRNRALTILYSAWQAGLLAA